MTLVAPEAAHAEAAGGFGLGVGEIEVLKDLCKESPRHSGRKRCSVSLSDTR